MPLVRRCQIAIGVTKARVMNVYLHSFGKAHAEPARSTIAAENFIVGARTGKKNMEGSSRRDEEVGATRRHSLAKEDYQVEYTKLSIEHKVPPFQIRR
jgi:hypothetical protein